jgi:hypothetical protein
MLKINSVSVVASLALHVNVVPPFPMPHLLLLLSCCCCCRHCCHCCLHCLHFRNCQVVVHRVLCCHRHPSRLPINPLSLLPPPCCPPSLPPLNTVFNVYCACHHCPSMPPSNADTSCHHPPPLLSKAIFAAITLPLRSNTVKHCCCNQMPLLNATVVHYHHQTPLLIAPSSIRHFRHHSLPLSNANACCEH